jgi:hypothetical protein
MENFERIVCLVQHLLDALVLEYRGVYIFSRPGIGKVLRRIGKKACLGPSDLGLLLFGFTQEQP